MNFKLLISALLIFISSASFGQVRVKGYVKKDGTYVAPHMRSSPNNIISDNWSIKGNVNPYTGKSGTKTNPSPTKNTFYNSPTENYNSQFINNKKNLEFSNYQLASSYFYGRGVPQDYRTAFFYGSLAAEQGSADAMVMLGVLFGKGLGLKRNDEIAAKWMFKAAMADNTSGQYNIALSYYHGRGVARSKENAAHWFLKAAENGHIGAKAMIGEMYFSGIGVSKDLEKASLWLSEPAVQGHGYAQYKMGLMSLANEAGAENLPTAARWLTLAAEQGVSEAQLMIGIMYRDGVGVERNNIQAYKWLKLAFLNASKSNSENIAAVPFQELCKKMLKSDKISGDNLVEDWNKK